VIKPAGLLVVDCCVHELNSRVGAVVEHMICIKAACIFCNLNIALCDTGSNVWSALCVAAASTNVVAGVPVSAVAGSATAAH
jgi:hypothetical protein